MKRQADRKPRLTKWLESLLPSEAAATLPDDKVVADGSVDKMMAGEAEDEVMAVEAADKEVADKALDEVAGEAMAATTTLPLLQYKMLLGGPS